MKNLEKVDTVREIQKAVEDFFVRDEVSYTPFDERNVAKATYRLQSKLQRVNVYFRVYKRSLIIRLLLPLSAGKDERAKVAEFLLRANYGLKIGGFDFDFEDGEISYRVSIYCGDEEFKPPTYEQIENCLINSALTVDRYGDGLIKVLFGLAEPEDAIEAAESSH